MPAVSCGRTGTGRVAVGAGTRRVSGSLAPVPVPACLGDHRALAAWLALPHLEMTAWPGAVPIARHHARQLVWDAGLKELIDAVELVVSELVTNAVRACGGLDIGRRAGAAGPVVRLWVSFPDGAVLVLVWDASSVMPQRQVPGPDAEKGRGLVLVEMLSAAWGVFELVDDSGKVVWALCRS